MLVMLAAAAAALAPVQGDFDQDGRSDVAAVVGHQLVVTRGAGGPPVTVAELKDLRALHVGKLAPGEYATACAKSAGRDADPCPRRSVRLTGDTLGFGTKEASQAAAVWTGAAFEVVWLAD